MIRRSMTGSQGKRRWLLISQIEHARLAGDLAQYWGRRPIRKIAPYQEVLATIYHHDDGWTAWEQSPEVDPRTGQPLAFTEMPLEVSLPIWETSIDLATRIGKFAPWLVAAHFESLLAGSSTAHARKATSWLTEMESRRREWLAAWQADDPAENGTDVAEQARKHLQTFDALSLWFCCSETTQPHHMVTPDGQSVLLTPRSPDQVEVVPWPFSVDELVLKVEGHAIPVDRYENASALANAPREPITLSWRLADKMT